MWQEYNYDGELEITSHCFFRNISLRISWQIVIFIVYAIHVHYEIRILIVYI